MTTNLPRILLAAAGSDSGKTTVLCAILSALKAKGIRPAAFKCGPDYLDPLFHQAVLKVPSDNLDLFLMHTAACQNLLAQKAGKVDVALAEGVMGYYDGLATTDCCSSYQVAKQLQFPTVLTVCPQGVSVTLAAVLNGLAQYKKESQVRGVIFNRIKPVLYAFYQKIVEENTPLRVYGYLPDLPDCRFESRHLGLITPAEVTTLQEKIDRLGQAALQSIDLPGLLALAKQAPAVLPSPHEEQVERAPTAKPVRIAVAKDAAFCFYYEAALQTLRDKGAELLPFSPLVDEKLPACDGLYLGGGYPELHAGALAENRSMRASVHQALAQGMPCVAECGGFLYLQKTLKTQEGQTFPMVGTLPLTGWMTDHLNRFGYVKMQAKQDTLLAKKGEFVRAHAFHYAQCSEEGTAFFAQKPFSARGYACGHASAHLLAGFPHLHFAGAPALAARFVQACAKGQGEEKKA